MCVVASFAYILGFHPPVSLLISFDKKKTAIAKSLEGPKISSSVVMDDGEVKLSDHILLPQPDSSTNFPNSASVDSFLEELLKNTRTCTHTHTCIPPGPDSSGHTHTCYHAHTRVLTSEEDESQRKPSSDKSKRPLGNREAVRKYREKKKAHTAYLEEEVKKLRALNQQLVRKLQGQAILEAEVVRLRGLLLDLRGKIDNELGVFPFQKPCTSTNTLKEGDCRVRCETDLPCLHPHFGLSSQAQGCIGGAGKVSVASIDSRVKMGDDTVSPDGYLMDRVGALVSSASQAE
ncbi:hypothetical protein CRG98_016613 [Punica granatum]|nr:hypothetical protein CRG98_016613 [Punica granatum]